MRVNAERQGEKAYIARHKTLAGLLFPLRILGKSRLAAEIIELHEFGKLRSSIIFYLERTVAKIKKHFLTRGRLQTAGVAQVENRIN